VRRGEEKGQKYQMIQEEFQILERVKQKKIFKGGKIHETVY